jgi:hypothetical protein
MKLTLQRVFSNKEETIGLLYIDGILQAVTLEDEKRAVKVAAETRIPDGEYVLGLRKEGGHHAKYSKMFPAIHKGMLELQKVPNFQYILIHIGNTDDDTAGCILLGEKFYISNTGSLSIENSTLAYQKVYKKVIEEISKGKEVSIKIESIEKPI